MAQLNSITETLLENEMKNLVDFQWINWDEESKYLYVKMQDSVAASFGCNG